MALMTGEQYIESIRKIPMEIYMFGKKVENPVDNPILRPSLNSVRMTYDLAQMPEYQDLMTVISPDTGERINRFTHIHRSTEDLRNKVKMQRLLGQKTAACFQRCVGLKQISGTGGQVDFVRGASASKGGVSIMAFPSTAAKGTVSKIVPFLDHGSTVTTCRCDVDYAVTEYGVAHLKGETLRTRARNLIGITHPDFRAPLIEEFEKRFHCKF